MKLITNLSGIASEGDYREPRGALTTMHCEPQAGVHVKIMLGAAGLVFSRADVKLAIPLAELTTLAFRLLPELQQITAAETPQTQADAVSAAARRSLTPSPAAATVPPPIGK